MCTVKTGLDQKEIDETVKKIDNRISKLIRLFNKNGSLPYPITETNREAHAGATTTKLNKFLKNRNKVLKNLLPYLSAINNTSLDAGTFQKAFLRSMGLVDHAQDSDYVVFALPDGQCFSLRLSNHSAHAKRYEGKTNRAEDNYSIVIAVPSSPSVTFRAKDGINIREFIYINPSPEKLRLIAYSLFNLIDKNEYVDLAIADSENYSPITTEDII